MLCKYFISEAELEMRRRRARTISLYKVLFSTYKAISNTITEFKKATSKRKTSRGITQPRTRTRKTPIIMSDNTIHNGADFRPKKFSQIVGQNIVKEYLQLKIKAFKKSNNAVGHCLFLGFSGCGKTTMANVMATEMGVRFHSIMATRIKTWNDFYQIIKNVETNDVVFIDEIHALAPKIQEQLYGVMEDFICTLEDKNLQQQIQVKLPRFTLIGATTHTGDLNAALLSRFQYKGQLVPYTHQELTDMVVAAGERIYDLDVPDEVAERIAKLSRRTARVCYNLLRSYVDVVEAEYDHKINSRMLSMDLLYKTLKLEQIDPIVGLDYVSRKYLLTMLKDQEMTPLGCRSIANMINEQESTITEMIEPFLTSDILLEYKKEGKAISSCGPFSKVTKRGRVATQSAYTYMKMCQSLQTQGWFANEAITI
jgi:Holliday junction DNA helicase RuvB